MDIEKLETFLSKIDDICHVTSYENSLLIDNENKIKPRGSKEANHLTMPSKSTLSYFSTNEKYNEKHSSENFIMVRYSINFYELREKNLITFANINLDEDIFISYCKHNNSSKQTQQRLYSKMKIKQNDIKTQIINELRKKIGNPIHFKPKNGESYIKKIYELFVELIELLDVDDEIEFGNSEYIKLVKKFHSNDVKIEKWKDDFLNQIDELSSITINKEINWTSNSTLIKKHLIINENKSAAYSSIQLIK